MAELLVWHVFGTMDVGGAELRTLELASALRKREVRFEYVTLSGRSGHLDNRITVEGGRIHRLPLGPAFPYRFVKSLRQHRPDVLDSHVATFSGLLLALAWLAGVPVRIAHFRSDGDGHPGTPRRRLQRRAMTFLIDRCATHIVGVSPSALSYGYRKDWEDDPRAQVIPNGLSTAPKAIGPSLRLELGIPAEARLMMHVGRPSPEKNRPLAVRVLSSVREVGVDAHLVFVGGAGVDAEALASVIEELSMSPFVHEIGRRSNAPALMAQAGALLLTSNREGLPGVVLESLSVGTPVVSTPLPGALFIGDAVPGVRTVDEGDLDGWAQALNQATDLAEEQRDSIRAAFQAGPFSLDRAAREHEAVYRSREFHR